MKDQTKQKVMGPDGKPVQITAKFGKQVDPATLPDKPKQKPEDKPSE